MIIKDMKFNGCYNIYAGVVSEEEDFEDDTAIEEMEDDTYYENYFDAKKL